MRKCSWCRPAVVQRAKGTQTENHSKAERWEPDFCIVSICEYREGICIFDNQLWHEFEVNILIVMSMKEVSAECLHIFLVN